MGEKSLHQENERFEKSMKMFEENQKMQMEQLLLYPDLKINEGFVEGIEPVNVTHVLFTFGHSVNFTVVL